jgi:hypothetical protein
MASHSDLRHAFRARDQSEIKARTLADCRINPDFPLVASDDPMNSRKSDSGSLELRAAVKALKRLEEPMGCSCIEADAVVPHEEPPLPSVFNLANLDAGCSRSSGELTGVRHEVCKHLARQCTVDIPDHTAGFQIARGALRL